MPIGYGCQTLDMGYYDEPSVSVVGYNAIVRPAFLYFRSIFILYKSVIFCNK